MTRTQWRNWGNVVLLCGLAAAPFSACSSTTKKKVMFTGDAGAAGALSDGGDAGKSHAGTSGTGATAGTAGSAGTVSDAGDGGLGGDTSGIGAAGQAPIGDAGAAGAPTQTPHVFQFPTITALYDAIDAATITNGDSWSVSWAADARITTSGALTGIITAGAPNPSVFDQGAVPLKLFAAKDWLTDAPTGDFTFDADGYPELQQANTITTALEIRTKLNDARYSLGRFLDARMRISQDVTGAADFTGVAFTLFDVNDQEGLVGNHFVEVGGGSMSVALDYYAGGVQTLSLGSGATSTRVFDGVWDFVPSTPFSSTLSMNNLLYDLQANLKGQRGEVITGNGDWSANTGVLYSPGFRIYVATGGTGTSTAVGVSFDFQRYVP